MTSLTTPVGFDWEIALPEGLLSMTEVRRITGRYLCIVLTALLSASCTMNGSTTFTTTTKAFGGSWSGRVAGGRCAGAVASFTVKDGQVYGAEANDYELSHKSFAGTVNDHGTAVVYTLAQRDAQTRRELDIVFEGDTFEMHADLECSGDAVFKGTRTHLAQR